MKEDKHSMNTSLGFILDLEKILSYLANNNTYMAQIGEINIKYIGEKEDSFNGKRQVFEIQRKIIEGE